MTDSQTSPKPKPIQVFQPRFDIEACLDGIRECLERGWTGIGFKTEEFERAWCSYTGLPNAHFLNSNTVGLQLALKLYKKKFNWNDGDEVITTPLTFVSTNHAILLEGLRPVFADVDEYLCLDPESICQRITERTRAVMFVGMGGNVGRLAEVVKFCSERKLTVILDAAHMSGTKFNGRHVGTEVDCSVFSFQAVKNLPTADSGMICFSDPEDDKLVRQLSWLGIDKDTYARSDVSGGSYKWLYSVEDVGLKAHGNSIMAAIALAQLPHLEGDNEIRRRMIQTYQDLLSDLPITFIPVAPNCESSFHLAQIRVPELDRDKLVDTLMAAQIFPGVHYRINTKYKMYAEAYGTCPNAEIAEREIISLPLHLHLGVADLERVAGTIRRFFDR